MNARSKSITAIAGVLFVSLAYAVAPLTPVKKANFVPEPLRSHFTQVDCKITYTGHSEHHHAIDCKNNVYFGCEDGNCSIRYMSTKGHLTNEKFKCHEHKHMAGKSVHIHARIHEAKGEKMHFMPLTTCKYNFGK